MLENDSMSDKLPNWLDLLTSNSENSSQDLWELFQAAHGSGVFWKVATSLLPPIRLTPSTPPSMKENETSGCAS